ncbi:protein FAM110B isoform X2 [Lingula anatina]|nr:protein FAM110B isoform X2 [Lingula anatina]XP_013413250.1 protein FAM110B isoform X2 [Lingula anatina]XP_013413252.1 protein FAM110B isoform X2 [Lingula anatina]|eukprot:XP_013413249.1 protein FAM110B isoform X2 [Lingula anatina]
MMMVPSRCKSAVQLLEETKSQYVKSTTVLVNKQKPRNAENLQVGTRQKNLAPPSELDGKNNIATIDRGQLQADVLSNTATAQCRSSPNFSAAHVRGSAELHCRLKLQGQESCCSGPNAQIAKDLDSFTESSRDPVGDSPPPKSVLYKRTRQQIGGDASAIIASSNGGATGSGQSPYFKRARQQDSVNITSQQHNQKMNSIDRNSQTKSSIKSTSSRGSTGHGSPRRIDVRPKITILEPVHLESSSHPVPQSGWRDYRGTANSSDNQYTTDEQSSSQGEGTGDSIVRLRPRRYSIQRSRSDLSHRFNRNSNDFSDMSSRLSRTSTDLEKFFNEMGLEGSVIGPMLKSQTESKDELQIFESASSLASPAKWSVCSGDSRLDLDGRATPTSVVERNARIIKWLCNVRKARSRSTSELE